MNTDALGMVFKHKKTKKVGYVGVGDQGVHIAFKGEPEHAYVVEFDWTDAGGNKHHSKIDLFDCANPTPMSDTVTKEIPCPPETRTGEVAPTNGSDAAGELRAIGEEKILKTLSDEGNPTTHDLLNKAYEQAHTGTMDKAELGTLHAIERAVNPHKHDLMNAEEYLNTPVAAIIKRALN